MDFVKTDISIELEDGTVESWPSHKDVPAFAARDDLSQFIFIEGPALKLRLGYHKGKWSVCGEAKGLRSEGHYDYLYMPAGYSDNLTITKDAAKDANLRSKLENEEWDGIVLTSRRYSDHHPHILTVMIIDWKGDFAERIGMAKLWVNLEGSDPWSRGRHRFRIG
ncbi:hypothetical protein G7Y89_g10636 [Cudoniella acicularis]|uniref:Uncharacterized protein n=1 Tax=Cudoniella acicularis TaxID=354080 RepID=A0A8H4VYU4_9HELO|nr:hypothetical protein G7Y89_g10636 [Cudoniella acicularis]